MRPSLPTIARLGQMVGKPSAPATVSTVAEVDRFSIPFQRITTMMTATKPRLSTYEQLEPLVMTTLECYQTDFTVHDREWLHKNPGIPFILMVREAGTVMVGMYPANHESWPLPGEERRYIFGWATRQHILRDSMTIVDSNSATYRYVHFDGYRVREITQTAASLIARRHVNRVLDAWSSK